MRSQPLRKEKAASSPSCVCEPLGPRRTRAGLSPPRAAPRRRGRRRRRRALPTPLGVAHAPPARGDDGRARRRGRDAGPLGRRQGRLVAVVLCARLAGGRAQHRPARALAARRAAAACRGFAAAPRANHAAAAAAAAAVALAAAAATVLGCRAARTCGAACVSRRAVGAGAARRCRGRRGAARPARCSATCCNLLIHKAHHRVPGRGEKGAFL
jgi:hypothetical protein